MPVATSEKPALVLTPGVLYPQAEFRRVVGWGRHAWRTACLNGLPVIRAANRAYVHGDDAIEYLRRVGQPQRRPLSREEAAAVEGIGGKRS